MSRRSEIKLARSAMEEARKVFITGASDDSVAWYISDEAMYAYEYAEHIYNLLKDNPEIQTYQKAKVIYAISPKI
jgi:uncharacterized UPF0146 family protein